MKVKLTGAGFVDAAMHVIGRRFNLLTPRM
jgi:hypothetical protein